MYTALRRLGVFFVVTTLTACAGASAQQRTTPTFPPPGPTCEATCHRQYKECANGSRCMMAPQCDMEICIPEKQECLAHCDGAH